MKREKERLNRVIVIGATPAGIAATNKLGELGIPVTLLDNDADLDAKLGKKEWTLASGTPLNHAHRPGLIRIMRNSGIRTVLPARVASIRHNAEGFRVRFVREQSFVDAERCTLCGNCESVCPVTKEDGTKAVLMASRRALPGRPVIDKRDTPLCQKGCPLGVNAQGYVALSAAGRFSEALELVRESNVLPGICGRVCHHPCEDDCRRGGVDSAVSIRDIKRFLADWELENKDAAPAARKAAVARKEKIAVVGSGPAGLSAAAELAKAGCRVTVYDKEEKPGGLLRYGLGPHRLPREILDVEIDAIRNMGVTFSCGSSINLNGGLSDLAKAHDGVILATGTWADRPLGAAGETLSGVEGCLAFLGRFYRGEITSLPENVAVVGDGNAAFDLARTLVRMGASVTIVSWFGKDEIPADAHEVSAALAEGVTIVDRTQVIEFVGENGKFDRLRCRSTEPGEPGAGDVCWPVMVEGAPAVELSFDRAFVAIGQAGALTAGAVGDGLSVTERGLFAVDDAFRTSLSGVYAAGDAASGPSAVVSAMAGGRSAARQLLSDVCGLPLPEGALGRASARDFDEVAGDTPKVSRCAMPERKSKEACKTPFAEVALGLSGDQVVAEASRCLQCGVCSECFACKEVCGADGALDHYEPEKEAVEQAGVVIIADPAMAPMVKGEDVVRAYGPNNSKSDVMAMMTRGFAAASKAMGLLGKGEHRQRGRGISFTRPDPLLAPQVRIGVFACKCNESLGWHEKMDQFTESLTGTGDVVHAEVVESCCVPEGTAAILKAVRERGITRIALASCVCCPLNFVCSACTDQRSRLKHALFTATGIGPSMVETANIRGEALSLLRCKPEEALDRFKGLISRSVRRAAKLKQFPSPERVYNFTTAVIGQSEAAVESAKSLADAGLEVLHLGGAKPLEDTLSHPNIHGFANAKAQWISGSLGDFQVAVSIDGTRQILSAGAVILGEKARKKVRYDRREGLPAKPITFAMQEEGVIGLPFSYPGMTNVSGLFLADPMGINVSKRKKGAAAAVLAAAVMPRGPRQSKGFTVTVNQDRCRGCGRCLSACTYQAIDLAPGDMGGWAATVDEALCKGCGNCISVCPTSAADSPYRDQAFLEKSLEEILLA